MPKFRRKPLILKAVQFNGPTSEFSDDLSELNPPLGGVTVYKDYVLIEETSRLLRVMRGDWIIKNEKGKFYTCNNETFLKNYEPVSEEEKNENE